MKFSIKTKPFDLDAAKNGARLVTRDGCPARIVCWDRKNDSRKLIALVDSKCKEDVVTLTNNGCFYSNGAPHECDLFILEEPQYVPYESAEEFMQAQKEHGWYIKMDDRYNPHTDKDDDVWYIAPTEVTDRTLFFASISASLPMHAIKYNELVNYQWADGTPCGKIKGE